MCLQVFVFLNTTRSEIFHRRERNFLVSLFASEKKTDEGKVFTIAKLGTVKVCLLSLLHFKVEDLKKCVTDWI